MTMQEGNVPWYVLTLVPIVLIAQSTWLFLDARKHGHRYWLWGVLGLIQCPMPLLFYLIFIRKIFSRKH